MKISIIIPTYGRVDPLFKCLKSIHKQSYLPYEIILIDQNSNNLLNQHIYQFRSRVSYKFYHIRLRKRSATHARNKGINLAKGELILFLDDDAFLIANTYLEKVNQFFINNDVDGLTGMVVNRTVKFNFLKKLFFLYHEGTGDIIHSGQFSIKNNNKQFSQINCCPTTNLCVRKKALKKVRFHDKIKGYLKAMAAGSVKDPMDAYDIVVILW